MLWRAEENEKEPQPPGFRHQKMQGKGVREDEVQKKNKTGTLNEQITFNEVKRGSS